MGRPTKPIDPDDRSPLANLARDLRDLRERAGDPTLRQLAAQTHLSDTTLSAAMGGQHRPTLDVLQRLAGALGGDEAYWTERWEQLELPAASRDQPEVVETGERSRPERRRAWTLPALGGTAVVAAVVLGLMHWTPLKDDPGRAADSGHAPSVASISSGTTPTAATVPAPIYLVFDDLGGGSPIIDVYPGTTTAAADLVDDGTYRSGQRKVVVCKVAGRRVTSDPSSGERSRTSTWWLSIGAPTGERRYASLTYGSLSAPGADGDLLELVPTCPVGE